MTSLRVAVTGANGFVGRALCSHLSDQECEVIRLLRRGQATKPGELVVGDINSTTDWSAALNQVDVVVHLAARVHVTREKSRDPLAPFRETNVDGTVQLARAAVDAGVRRLIFLSSIKVHGETSLVRAFCETDTPAPADPYGQSKLEAEQALRRIAKETGLEIVILRPPLVYGPGVKANFLSLLRLVDRGYPLPLAHVANQRSLLYVGNLVDAIVVCMDHPRANGKAYLVADDECVSTAALIELLAHNLSRPARLFTVPLSLLRIAAQVTGRADVLAKLTDSLTVNTTLIRTELGWHPPYTLEQGIAATTRWYRQPNVTNTTS